MKPGSKISNSGIAPQPWMRPANSAMVCGAVTLAWVGKFSDPSVRLAMSGREARAAARCRTSSPWRPVNDAQTISSGQACRTAETNSIQPRGVTGRLLLCVADVQMDDRRSRLMHTTRASDDLGLGCGEIRIVGLRENTARNGGINDQFVRQVHRRSSSGTCPTTRAGLPTTMAASGTSRVTTLPAPPGRSRPR